MRPDVVVAGEQIARVVLTLLSAAQAIGCINAMVHGSVLCRNPPKKGTMLMQSQKYLVTIEDIAPQGPELSDEELRATRGGTYGPCSSTRGLDDWDSHPL